MSTSATKLIGLLLEGIQLSIAAVDLAQRAQALNAKQRVLYDQMKADGEVSVEIQQQVEDQFKQLEAAGFEFRRGPDPLLPNPERPGAGADHDE